MNVLIVSSKDETETIKKNLDASGNKLEDLENEDQANRSIIGG